MIDHCKKEMVKGPLGWGLGLHSTIIVAVDGDGKDCVGCWFWARINLAPTVMILGGGSGTPLEGGWPALYDGWLLSAQLAVEALDAAGDAEEFFFEYPFFSQDVVGVTLARLCLVYVLADTAVVEFSHFLAILIGVAGSHCPVEMTPLVGLYLVVTFADAATTELSPLTTELVSMTGSH